VYSLKGVISAASTTYVQIQTNDDVLKIVGSLAAGETLIIDSGLVTAKVVDAQGDTLRNGLPLLQELNFPVLHKGNNTVTITANGATFTELDIQAKSRWR
jgi:phage-related protein